MFEDLVEMVKTVGGLASCIMSIGALITLFVKPVREKILMTSKERDAQKECDKCLLRNEITDFYYSHKDSKVLSIAPFFHLRYPFLFSLVILAHFYRSLNDI